LAAEICFLFPPHDPVWRCRCYGGHQRLVVQSFAGATFPHFLTYMNTVTGTTRSIIYIYKQNIV
jgi:hypothetical protein